MSVMLNARGTTVPHFTIGKGGVTIYQGNEDPNTNYVLRDGDYWFKKNSKQINVWSASTASWSAPQLADIQFLQNSIVSPEGTDLLLSAATRNIGLNSNSVTLGLGATASITNGLAQGDGAVSSLYGQKSYANGMFSSPGDAQHCVYVLRNQTTDDTITELYLDGISNKLIIPFKSVVTFSATITARRIDGTTGYGAGYLVNGVVKKDATHDTIAFIGTPSRTILGESDSSWDATIAVNSNGHLRINVSGSINNTIRWVATIVTTEVSN